MSQVQVIFERIDQLHREYGARVRARRRELHMSQSNFGDKLGVTFQQVQKYERGVNRISTSTMEVIAEALERRVTDLMGLNEDKGKPAIDWSKYQDHKANAAIEAFAAIESEAVKDSMLNLLRTLSEPKNDAKGGKARNDNGDAGDLDKTG